MTGRLLLIFPRSFAVSYGDMQHVRPLMGRAGLLNISLATLAAMTPPELEVVVVDENHEPIPYDGGWDLVGLTGFHTQLNRAAEIAERFRERGVPVVCGGPSVSVSPQRWRPFADVLVIGEAERTWPRFCQDFLSGRHEDTYHEQGSIDLAETPMPDYAGFSDKTIKSCFGGIVQTSRGCPFSCEFCDVIVYVGRKMRYKPVGSVVAEVEQLHRMGFGFIVLADDNFSAGRANAKAILRALRDYNDRQRQPVSFATQLSIDTAEDAELLRLAAEAGLSRVLIGIESPSEASLREANKLQNVRADMVGAIRTFHEHGIMVIGTSIVGFDHDDLGVFDRHYDFYMEAGIISPQPFPLQAPDGTPLKRRVQAEGRYRDWKSDLPAELTNNFNTFTMTPKQMTVEQLEDGLHDLIARLYEPAAAVRRLETFFSHFEESPHRASLRIPRAGLDVHGLAIAGRLLRHELTRASRQERRLLKDMLQIARRSSHPQRFALTLGNFLHIKNVTAMHEKLGETRRLKKRSA